MFSSLARLRALALTFLLSASLVRSKEESLFTSSVTYCEPPETLLIQQFDVAYIAHNQSVFFNISAASVEANVNVTANLLLNVYGMNPINVTIDLCNILGGALCPLPMYNFTGSQELSLPSSLGVSSQIPPIAYKMPDLEAFAQLTLIEVGTGDVKACVQATLSNGWSTHQPAVEWSTGALALFALLAALWQSYSPDLLAPYRLLDLLYLYQTIAATAFLSLNYPSVYRGFTLNFSWAMGLFSSASSSLQRSINNMRHLTGGTMANATVGSAVGLVNRKLSPYNVPDQSNYVIPSQSFLSLGSPPSDFPSLSTLFSTDTILAADPNGQFPVGEVETVTTTSSNILQAGVPIYVNSIHIATANAFMTVFICALSLLAIALAIFSLGYIALLIMKPSSFATEERRMELKRAYPSFVRAWSSRLGLIAFTPIVIFVFYQWTLKDSWLSVLISVIAFLATIGYILYPTLLTLRLAFRSTPSALYSSTEHLSSYGPLYAQYRMPRYYFFAPLLVASFLKALFISAARGNGEVQVILMLIVEFLVFFAHVLLRPLKSRGGDVLSTFLAIVRLVCTGLMIAFVERLAVKAIPRVVIGVVIAVIFSITVIVMFVNLIINSGVNRLWTHTSSPNSSARQESSHESMLEKGSMTSLDSRALVGRPVNPSPERNVRPALYDDHPLSAGTSTPTTAESPSTSDSGSTTMGSMLPRRWSFSQPNTPTSSSHLH